MKINEAILQYLNTLGISAVGFCDAEPLAGYADFILNQHHNESKDNALHTTYLDVYRQSDIRLKEWFDPKAVFPSGKSIIVILYPYHLETRKLSSVTKELSDKKNRSEESVTENEEYSLLSKASVFKDYHKSMTDIMSSLHNYIMVNFGKESAAFCDFGPLNDKAIALKTGLVKIGRNSLLYHPKFGSRFYIGYLITELECEHASYSLNTAAEWQTYLHPFCSKCGKCMASCPNKAIQDFGYLTASKCIAFLTQSKEWTLEQAINGGVESLGGYAYGCDICQIVCPLNTIPLTQYVRHPLVNERIDLSDLQISNKIFKESYGQTSVGWIGKKRLERNLLWNQYVKKRMY